MDRAGPAGGPERAVEHREVLRTQCGRALDRLLLVDVLDDLLHFLGIVPEAAERPCTVVLTILRSPPPTSFLYLTSAMSGSTPVVSQSIMKAMVPVGASTVTCELRTPPVRAAASALSPCLARRAQQVERHEHRIQPMGLGAMLVDDVQLRLAVRRVARVGAEVGRDPARLEVGFAAHHGRDGRRVFAASIGIVRQPERHEERSQVGVAEPELAIGVRVGGDLLRRIARLIDHDVLRRDQEGRRRAGRR
jgi:hypothetical protein